ncbi:MAG TPA: methyltransferase domain-containing protein [Planctomycetota bacterium]|jgi:SAM-dependent methyltransferase|nr:methyltransferase domain-containing protein [Planctomycetota bacterium]
MLKKLIGKLKSVTRKNLARVRARSAVKKGLFAAIDVREMAAIRKKYDGSPFRKYHDKMEHSFVRNAERVFTIGLHQSPGLRILDIGCGFGYFMYAAERFGHRTVGVDLPDPYLQEVTDLLGLKKVLHRIEPFQPLPELPGGPFDLITAFATCFDSAGFNGQWGVKEWQYFMKDLKRFMAPGCRMHFKFNQYTGGGSKSGIDCRSVPTDLGDYFHSLGGVFDKRTLRIPDAPSKL